mmetsp:Transcript_4724/g.8316  ORF Transcript_4724/g.8316 Transcript_4724/m.8316 type:complete len:238 (-) Transcript_4724:2086-2799(-)
MSSSDLVLKLAVRNLDSEEALPPPSDSITLSSFLSQSSTTFKNTSSNVVKESPYDLIAPCCCNFSHSSVSSGKTSVHLLSILIDSSEPAPFAALASGMIFCTVFMTSSLSDSFPIPISFKMMVSTYPAPNCSFSSRQLPHVASFPLCMIPILSQRMSASSMKCVLSRMTLSFLFFLMMSHVSLLLLGSIPEVGSSSTTSFGLPMKAMPTESFLICPPDSSQLGQFSFSFRPTSSAMP